jgi:Lrp/AsnC family leucine-responsive transcriptional regulator
MTRTTRKIDQIDRRILAALQADGRMSIVDLADKVNLSKTPCQARVKRLERDGFITGYKAVLDATKLDRGHIAFVQVSLDRTTTDVFNRFHQAVRRIPQVQSCHMVAGGFDYLLRICCKDIVEYRTLLGDVLTALPGVMQTHTYVVMETVKDETDLPLDNDLFE